MKRRLLHLSYMQHTIRIPTQYLADTIAQYLTSPFQIGVLRVDSFKPVSAVFEKERIALHFVDPTNQASPLHKPCIIRRFLDLNIAAFKRYSFG